MTAIILSDGHTARQSEEWNEKPGHDTVWKVVKEMGARVKRDPKSRRAVSHRIKRETESKEEASQGVIERVRGV